MAYVRDAAKDHGQQNRIEGRIEDGETVVVVEDLISTGQSALSAVEAVRAAGATVAAVVAVFSYDLDASAERFAAADVPLHVLTTFPILVEEAHAQDALSAEALDLLRAWRADPKAWSDRFT
jgi:orotate phosphoribosyltransferase